MGTRSLTFVYDDYTQTPICCMYRQMDGYPSGHGKDLHGFLAPIKMVNGLSLSGKEVVANGMGCLAAQMVAHFKEGPGGIYLQFPDVENSEEYDYHIRCIDGKLHVWVDGNGEALFKGDLEDFKAFCERDE